MKYFIGGIVLFLFLLIIAWASNFAGRLVGRGNRSVLDGVRIRRFFLRAAIAVFIVNCCLVVPLPGIYVAVPAAPSDYTAPGTEGRIQAPNIKHRPMLVGEWIELQSKRAYAIGLPASSATDAVAAPASVDIDMEVIESLYQLPYEVPESLYGLENGETDPHAVMKVLAEWIKWSGNDWTQGQTVMGVGAVTPDGKILMVDDIEMYAKAASKAKPKVFFVPVEAYETVRAIDKDLLVVPITGFKEVLYFIEQPVTFWPLRNFALFCH